MSRDNETPIVSELETDELYVALTRPATVAGVPSGAFIFEIIVVAMVFLGLGNILWLVIIAPIHVFLYWVSAVDPGRFSSWAMFGKTFGRCVNGGFWKAASFSPLSTKRDMNH